MWSRVIVEANDLKRGMTVQDSYKQIQKSDYRSWRNLLLLLGSAIVLTFVPILLTAAGKPQLEMRSLEGYYLLAFSIGLTCFVFFALEMIQKRSKVADADELIISARIDRSQSFANVLYSSTTSTIFTQFVVNNCGGLVVAAADTVFSLVISFKKSTLLTAVFSLPGELTLSNGSSISPREIASKIYESMNAAGCSKLTREHITTAFMSMGFSEKNFRIDTGPQDEAVIRLEELKLEDFED